MLTLLQVAFLVVQLVSRSSLTRATTAAACLGILGSLILSVASHIEHYRSVRASTVLLLYLACSTPADALRARTLWSMPQNIPTAAIFTVFVVCKLLLLILESRPKSTRPGVRRPTPDEKANILSRAFLWWLIPLIRLGYGTTLTAEALPEIEPMLTRAIEIQGK